MCASIGRYSFDVTKIFLYSMIDDATRAITIHRSSRVANNYFLFHTSIDDDASHDVCRDDRLQNILQHPMIDDRV